MTLLEVVKKASANTNQLTSQSNYPIILNPDPVLLKLKPPNNASLVMRVEGWQISEIDSAIIELGQKFFKNLNRNLKNPNSFSKDECIEMLKAYLEKNGEKVGISIGIDPSDVGFIDKLIEKLGFLMVQEVLGLVLEACIVMELWELLETLLICGLIKHSSSSNLVYNLIQNRRSDLVCLCLKHVVDLQSSDMLCILKYFLSPSKDAYSSMVSLRKDWETEALSAIEKATDKSLSGKKLNLAKEASVLLMMAYDGFSASELCLHYFLASKDLDEVILSSCISKLNGLEMMSLIRYLGKWLRKYEKFPCSKASFVLGLNACEWVPALVNIVKCFGLVIDEHFSSLFFHTEFHEELRESTIYSIIKSTSLVCYQKHHQTQPTPPPVHHHYSSHHKTPIPPTTKPQWEKNKKNKNKKQKHQHPNDQTTKKTTKSSDFSFKATSDVKGLRFGGQFIVKSFTIRRARPLELLRLLSLDKPTTTKPQSFPSTTAFLPTNFTILAHHAWHTLTLGLGTKKSKVLLFVFESEDMKVAVDRTWQPEIPLGEVNRKLIRGLSGCEMARFKFRKGCITFYVYAVRRIGTVGFSCADDLRLILEYVIALNDFLDHTAMLTMPNQRSISYAAAQVAMAH